MNPKVNFRNAALSVLVVLGYSCILTIPTIFVACLFLEQLTTTSILLTFVCGMVGALIGDFYCRFLQTKMLNPSNGGLRQFWWKKGSVAVLVILVFAAVSGLMSFTIQGILFAIFASCMVWLSAVCSHKDPTRLCTVPIITGFLGIAVFFYMLSAFANTYIVNFEETVFPFESYVIFVFPFLTSMLIVRNQTNIAGFTATLEKQPKAVTKVRNLNLVLTLCVIGCIFILYLLRTPIATFFSTTLTWLGGIVIQALLSAVRWLHRGESDTIVEEGNLFLKPIESEAPSELGILMGKILVLFCLLIVLFFALKYGWNVLRTIIRRMQALFTKSHVIESEYYTDQISSIDVGERSRQSEDLTARKFRKFMKLYRQQDSNVNRIRFCYAYLLSMLNHSTYAVATSDTPTEIQTKIQGRHTGERKIDVSGLTQTYIEVRYAQEDATDLACEQTLADIKKIAKELK